MSADLFLRPYQPGDAGRLSEFLLAKEEYWTALTARLFRRGRLLPVRTPEEISLVTRGDQIVGLIYNEATGYTFPAFLDSPGRAEEKLLRQAVPALPRVLTLLGETRLVDLCIAARKSSPAYRVDYLLMARPAFSAPLRPAANKTGEIILQASPSMARALYPLQKAYEKEEVLLEPKRFNPLICMNHLKETLANQVVFAVREGGRFTAKAGTNARGVHWSQIGGVFTAPERRGEGLAGRLMTRLLLHLEQEGQGATLFVKKHNIPAVSLYRSVGFRETGEFTIAYYLR